MRAEGRGASGTGDGRGDAAERGAPAARQVLPKLVGGPHSIRAWFLTGSLRSVVPTACRRHARLGYGHQQDHPSGCFGGRLRLVTQYSPSVEPHLY
jgi:hypothetical protein